jgi:hypothetical protein
VTGLQLADRVLQFGNSGIVVRGKIVCQSITLHIQVVSKISDLLGRPTLESVSGALVVPPVIPDALLKPLVPVTPDALKPLVVPPVVIPDALKPPVAPVCSTWFQPRGDRR